MKLPTAEAAQWRLRWIANAVSEPGRSVDVWRADWGVVDISFSSGGWMSGGIRKLLTEIDARLTVERKS